jgi:Sigma-54 interaction domain
MSASFGDSPFHLQLDFTAKEKLLPNGFVAERVYRTDSPLELIGSSPSIARVRRAIAEAASCDAKVLITGESGSGKEVIARLIHHASRRSRHDLVTLNCGAVLWSAVYVAYMSRDLTRSDMRQIVTRGLRETRGNYRSLISLFNMPPGDYKKFLNFLKKHSCHVAFQPFRIAAHDVAAAERAA